MTRPVLQIHVRLHGALRDRLPPEEMGRTIVTLPDGAQVATVLRRLSLRRRIAVSVNNEIVDDWNTTLQDGDQVEIFRPAAGGSAVDCKAHVFLVH
jgi:thiamine biosynthesis protein ThiS